MKSTTFLLIFLAFLAKGYSLTVPLDIETPSVVLIDGKSGAVLYEKAAYEKRYPGSTTKVATALYALEKCGKELDQLAEASREALHITSKKERQAENSRHPPYRLEMGGTMANLKVGEKRSLRDNLYGLMMPSGNDSANVIAEYVSGSIPRFIEELNDYLRSIGIANTHFNNPHGLHSPKHYTTAYDLAMITKEAMKHPFFREVARTVRWKTQESNLQEPAIHIQKNALLRAGKHFYPKAVGVKIGFTNDAGCCLVAAAEHNGRLLIAVTLGAKDKDKRYQETISLFEAAFAEKPVDRVLLAKETDRFSHKIIGASRPVEAVVHQDINVQYYPSENPLWKIEPVWEEKQIPILPGECVGKLRLIDERTGHIWNEYPLHSLSHVDKTWKIYVIAAKEMIAAHEWMRYSISVLAFAAVILFFYLLMRKLSV